MPRTTHTAARAAARATRAARENGILGSLLTTSNPKALLGEAAGYQTFLLHFAPARSSGFQVCPMASAGCTAVCLGEHSGHSAIIKKGETTNAVRECRKRRTLWFFNDRDTFMLALVRDVERAIRTAARRGLIPCFRLNATSDIRWENEPCVRDGVTFPNIMSAFPGITFYDYTKLPNRRNLPTNYTLTFSRAEHNDTHARAESDAGNNVAVVFRKTLPQTWNGRQVIDGLATDLRFLDPRGVVVGLLAKGRKAQRDTSGFVLD